MFEYIIFLSPLLLIVFWILAFNFVNRTVKYRVKRLEKNWVIQSRGIYKWNIVTDREGTPYYFENAETAGYVIAHALKKND